MVLSFVDGKSRDVYSTGFLLKEWTILMIY